MNSEVRIGVRGERRPFARVVAWVERVGALPDDDDELRLRKATMVRSSLLIILAGLLWGLFYFFLDRRVAGAIPWAYADAYEAVSVLFADVVGFTPLSEQMPPEEMIGLLNDVFRYFDALVARYGVEKIRTIGDNYMVAAGAPRPRPDHAHVLAQLALEMNEFVADLPGGNGHHLQFRIGINSGPAIAGVIGQTKFHYDIWGDAVNTASRMESHGVPGKIQITRETHEYIKDAFQCEPRGAIEVKGKGEMETWFVVGRFGTVQ